jgi:hypothetical protein
MGLITPGTGKESIKPAVFPFPHHYLFTSLQKTWFMQSLKIPTENRYEENPVAADPPDTSMFEEPPFIYGGSDLPPGIASEFPEHVYQFEQAWQEAKTISVSGLLGNPFFLLENELDDAVLENELVRLITLLQQNNMGLDIPVDKEPRDVYRFITEFLFEQEIDDLQLNGLSRLFIYNDDYAE